MSYNSTPDENGRYKLLRFGHVEIFSGGIEQNIRRRARGQRRVQKVTHFSDLYMPADEKLDLTLYLEGGEVRTRVSYKFAFFDCLTATRIV